MRKTFVLIVVSFFSFFLQAQNLGKVFGTVRDAVSNEELIGATVMLSGKKTGTITDMKGNFTILAPQDGTLLVSYLGYKPQEVKIADQKNLEIKLIPESESMNEVEVVGYAVQKKRDVLGAVSKVNGSQLSQIPVASTADALQGRVAGVDVSSQTGAPGADISVRIRGVGSISSSNDPLYIVDGIPVQNALNNISPDEIQSITVLKDASSAAIYGSRANNGVVLITTKRGKAGATRISYNAQIGFQSHGYLTPMCNTNQYIQLYNQAANNDNQEPGAVVQRPLIEGTYVQNFPNVNHLADIFCNAPLQSHELSISGGNDKTQYLIFSSYFDQNGIIKSTGYKRFNLRSNINTEVAKWLHLGLDVSGGTSSNQIISSSGDGYAGGGGSVVRYALYRNPAIPVLDSKGGYVDLPSAYYGNSVYDSFFGDGYSPEGLEAYNNDNQRINSLLVSGNVLVKLPYDLYWKSTYGLDYSDQTSREYDETWGTLDRINNPNGLVVSNAINNNWTVNSTLNRSFKFAGKHNLTTMLGVEANKQTGYNLINTDSEFADSDPSFFYIGNGTGPKTAFESASASTLLSLFATANYNYNDKYYLSGIIRRDGSSRFSSGHQWGTFYSASAGWNIDSEDFMKNIQAINILKLRVGYGAIGNQNIGLYANTDRVGGQFYYTFGGNSYNGYAQYALGNNNLKWETSNQLNVGADLEMFNESLGLTLDYYYKVTSNMLVQVPLPPSAGNVTPSWINDGSVLNTGVDVELFYRKNYKHGGFNITLNGGYLHNDVLSLPAPIVGGRVDDGVYATQTAVGHPIGSFYLYKMDGIFQNAQQILTSAYQGSSVRPGDVKYVDENHDGTINASDRVYMGSAIPIFTTGLTLAGNYRGFDMSLFFQGAFGQKIFSQVNYDIEGFYRGFNVTENFYKNHWTGEGTSNTEPLASWNDKLNNVMASSRFLEDGSYMRLKNIQVGYTIPNSKKLNIEKVRIYLAATNLLTFTKYSGLDPEMTVSTNSASEGDRANNIDWGTYPVSISYTIGLNITF
jgi:TonB-linked SusC/RagA family outer membrane protein